MLATLKGRCHGVIKVLQSICLFTNYFDGRLQCKVGHSTEKEKVAAFVKTEGTTWKTKALDKGLGWQGQGPRGEGGGVGGW